MKNINFIILLLIFNSASIVEANVYRDDEIWMLEVSNNEYIYRKVVYANYGLSIGVKDKWKETFMGNLNKSNDTDNKILVSVDIEEIYKKMSDIYLRLYRKAAKRLPNYNLCETSEGSLATNVRNISVPKYISKMRNIYIHIKRMGGEILNCNNGINEKHKDMPFPQICFNEGSSNILEYELLLPLSRDKYKNMIKQFASVFKNKNDVWVLSEIKINESLLKDRSLMLLACPPHTKRGVY